MGRPLFRDLPAATIIKRLTDGQVPYPIPFSDAPWGVPLAEVALRALEMDPEKRWPDVESMALRIERIADEHLATAPQVGVIGVGGGRESISDAVTARALSISDDVTTPWQRHNSSLSAMVTPIHMPALTDQALPSTPVPAVKIEGDLPLDAIR